jgi:hypothetical protein
VSATVPRMYHSKPWVDYILHSLSETKLILSGMGRKAIAGICSQREVFVWKIKEKTAKLLVNNR